MNTKIWQLIITSIILLIVGIVLLIVFSTKNKKRKHNPSPAAPQKITQTEKELIALIHKLEEENEELKQELTKIKNGQGQ